MRIGFFAICAIAITSATQAGVVYEFQQDGTGDVLATLELSSLPAIETEIVQLAFTPAGDALFGLGEAYDGTFDSSAKSFVDDGNGFLVSSDPAWGANIEDKTPEESSSVIGDLAWILMGTSDPGEPVDTIYIEAADFGSRVFALGSFVRVPEPTTAGLLGTALIGCVVRCRRS